MNVSSCVDNCDEQNRQVEEEEKHSSRKKENNAQEETARLQARVQTLKETMSTLREELLEEKVLWKKEMENLLVLSEQISESESNLVSESESLFKPLGNAPSHTGSDALIMEYEEKLSRYQGALAQAQAEKRYNIRRQIAVNTYRKRLNEVEKLCQEELAKVRETATCLEPLKQIASEWSKIKSDLSPREKNCRKLSPGGDFCNAKGKETRQDKGESFDVPVKQIDASLVVDEDAANEIKGKIVLQIGSLPSEVPTICYSAKFE